MTVFNLGDSTLYLTVSVIDTDTAKQTVFTTFEAEPEQFTRQASIPLRYVFDFSYDKQQPAALASCVIDVADTDEITFSAVAAGVVVTRNDLQPDDLPEMNVGTSSICRAGGAP